MADLIQSASNLEGGGASNLGGGNAGGDSVGFALSIAIPIVLCCFGLVAAFFFAKRCKAKGTHLRGGRRPPRAKTVDAQMVQVSMEAPTPGSRGLTTTTSRAELINKSSTSAGMVITHQMADAPPLPSHAEDEPATLETKI